MILVTHINKITKWIELDIKNNKYISIVMTVRFVDPHRKTENRKQTLGDICAGKIW